MEFSKTKRRRVWRVAETARIFKGESSLWCADTFWWSPSFVKYFLYVFVWKIVATTSPWVLRAKVLLRTEEAPIPFFSRSQPKDRPAKQVPLSLSLSGCCNLCINDFGKHLLVCELWTTVCFGTYARFQYAIPPECASTKNGRDGQWHNRGLDLYPYDVEELVCVWFYCARFESSRNSDREQVWFRLTYGYCWQQSKFKVG